MAKKRRVLIIFFIFFLIFTSIFSIASLFINYDCSNTPGPHYCSLNQNQPRLIERLSSIFHESIQVQLGGKLLTFRQDIISSEENDKAVSKALDIYSEMNLDNRWNNLPSSLGITYEKVLRLNLNPQQYYTYVPENTPTNIIVFLHGYGGNFKTYLYLLSLIAEDTDSLIVAPTYKSGVWDKDSIQFIDQSISDVLNKFNLNIDKLSLIGLSNGGLIFPEYLANSKYEYDNVIALSTYLNSNKYQDDKVKESLKNSRFTYIYGNKDTRIDIEYSLKSIQVLESYGIDIDTIPFEGDHLILFEERNLILSELKLLLSID